jgi:hypothetical protein
VDRHRRSTFGTSLALVVGYIARKAEYNTAAAGEARKWKSCSRWRPDAKAQIGNQTLL